MLNGCELNRCTLNEVTAAEIVQKLLSALTDVQLQKSAAAQYDALLKSNMSSYYSARVMGEILAQYSISDNIRREIIELISQIHKEINLNSPIDLEETQ
jgi:hypothetical protein